MVMLLERRQRLGQGLEAAARDSKLLLAGLADKDGHGSMMLRACWTCCWCHCWCYLLVMASRDSMATDGVWVLLPAADAGESLNAGEPKVLEKECRLQMVFDDGAQSRAWELLMTRAHCWCNAGDAMVRSGGSRGQPIIWAALNGRDRRGGCWESRSLENLESRAWEWLQARVDCQPSLGLWRVDLGLPTGYGFRAAG